MSRAIACLLALVLSLTGLGAASGAASAAPGDGYITGIVTGTAQQPLADVWVNASVWNPSTDEWDQLDAVQTNASGQYQLGPVAAGTYQLSFDASAPYAYGFLDGIVVAPGQTVTQNVQLVVGGSISGTVTNQAGNNVDGVYVVAWRWDAVEMYWTQAGMALTSLGEYDLRQLTPGRYRVEFQPTVHQPEFWNNASSLQTGRDISVASGQAVGGINAQLDDGVSLSGIATRADDSQPVSGVRVVAHRWNSVTKAWDQRANAISAGDGFYRLRGLAPGTYRLEFWYPGDAYTREFWPDAASLETATSFTIGTEDIWDRDVVLSTDPFPAVTNVVAPTVTGTAQVGQTLTASTGAWAPATGLSFTYQWLIGDRPIDGATSSTFTPATGVGKTVRVYVGAVKAGHTTAFTMSAASAALLPPAVVNTTLPSISGSPRVGTTVTASPGTWNPSDASLGYQWLIDGLPVTGATSSSYAATPSDLGRSLSVRVTASASSWLPTAATSAAAKVAPGVLTATVKPKVTGKPKKKAVLKVSTGRWSPAAVRVKLQWYAGAKAIRKATTAKLKLAGKTLKAVRKKAISVRVTVTAPGYTTVVTRLKIRGKVQ
ncbi:hypothetical protein GCM10023350_44010 [Nocardioides endophyticus]|uniref:Alpha-amylase n=1 Tax=Nocardioides endophyticus TaxID=1353775 RepID=A0ABP8ZE32_9ACTN